MSNLKDRVAIVTGSSRGIGKAIALALAQERVWIVVAARSETEKRFSGTILQTAQEIQELGGKALAVRTDLSKDEDIDALFHRVMDSWGRLDILVNNAGINPVGPVIDCPEKLWDRAFAVNLRAAYRCSRLAVPIMREQSWGHIVNVSSIMAHRLRLEAVPYAVTKAALEVLTEGMAMEIKEYNVAVNAIAPSYTDTEVVRYFYPDWDWSNAQRPEEWAKHTVAIVRQEPSAFSGHILSMDDCRRLFSG